MIAILHQQQEFLVVHKPSGMSVHNEPQHDLISLLSNQLSTKVSAVHRLDRDTSGILLCSTQPKTTTILQSSLQEGCKNYYAVVRGVMSTKEGSWDYPITDTSEGRRNPAGKRRYRKNARTSFCVQQTNQYFSFLSLTLHTGRQHQIRKHCVLAGHEIVGDSRYGDTRYQRNMNQRYKNKGMFLHAQRLSFSFLGVDFDFSCVPEGWEGTGFNVS